MTVFPQSSIGQMLAVRSAWQQPVLSGNWQQAEVKAQP